jgi:ribosomal protein L32
VPRRRVSRAKRTTRQSSPVRTLIGAVLVAFMLGLIYLAHTVHVAATNYETELLIAQRDDLARQIQTVETSVLRWGAEPTVVERAQRLGLDQLPTRVRLSAR